VRAAELSDRVVAVADEDALVELGGTLALGAVERPPSGGRIGGELVEVEASQCPLVARVAGEQRPLDGLGEVRQCEDRPVEVAEVGLERAALLRGEGFDGITQGASMLDGGSAGRRAVRTGPAGPP
jgi:hypothetical protein